MVAFPASKSTREEAENRAISLLGDGYSVAVMPEGRLVPEADRPEGVGQGRPGISRIASSANVHILPVGITGTEKVWPMRKAFPLFAVSRPTVKIRFGDPLKLHSADHIANVGIVMDRIKSLLD